MIGILLLITAASLLYYFAVKPYSYWAKKNVPTGKVTPIFGDNFDMIMGRANFADLTLKIYKKVPETRYSGVYQFHMPALVVKSPELIKQIFVKDFDHFLNRRAFVPDGVDELWSKNLATLKGQTWKNMRSKLSPSFTSSKMKAMFVLICHNADRFVQHFLQKNDELIEFEFKDAFTRYTNDVIASAAFGIQVDSLGERDNQFYLMGKEATNFSGFLVKIKFFLYQLFPKLAVFFNVALLPKNVSEFFLTLVKDTIKLREENNIKRPDMLGLLMEARKGQQKVQIEDEIKETSFAAVEEHLQSSDTSQDLTDTDIASQVFIFFLGGFESVALIMCFLAYELAANPDVQQKLIEEIDENKPKNVTPSYETIVNMTYLDMVVSETLRKWPIGILAERTVTKPYTIQPELPGEQPVHLDVDDNIMVPIYGIHFDPQYYPEPEKFDPERFSPENKKSIDPYTYLPFGVGPRNCIGSRFALLEIKAVFFYILSNFEIVPSDKTTIPLKFSKSALNFQPEGGFQFGFRKRF